LSCIPPHYVIRPFAQVKVLGGNGKVAVQFWLTDTTLNYQSGKLGLFKLMRSKQGEDKYHEVARLGPISPPPKAWCFSDSSVNNGEAYEYYIYATFSVFETPDDEGYSDTFTVRPASNLSDPRPPAPKEFKNLELRKDTVTLIWIPPQNHDSLYYILYSPTGLVFRTYDKEFDSKGNIWDPAGDKASPLKLDSARYTFKCSCDGDFRYYLLYAFRDSIMSYPSKVLKIKHTQ